MLSNYLEIAKNISASGLSIAGLVIGINSPDFFIPCSVFSFGCAYWVNRRLPGLPIKSDLLAAQHRRTWRDGVLAEVKDNADKLNNELSTKAQSINLSLQEKAELIQQAEEAIKIKGAEYKNWELSLVQAEKQLNATLQANQEYYEQLLQHQQQEYLSELQLRENTIATLQNKIMRIANRPDPKQGFAAWVAALLLEALEQHEIYCRLVSFQKIPGTREVSIWVDLEAGQQAKKLEAIAKEVGSWVKLGEPSITWDGDECIYEFHFAPNSFYEHELIENIEESAGLVIEEAPNNFLEEFIRNTDRLSAFICGDSGSGKSTFVNNYICLIKKIFEEQGEEVEIIIIDGKDPDSPWCIDGVNMIPQYGGINDEDDTENEPIENDCIEGLLYMKQDVYNRLRAKRKARDEGKEVPKFPKRIYVIDETEEIYSAYGKDASKPILSAARLGRSGGVAVIPIGQSSNCSAYGFQIPNLNNFVRAYLRENAKKGIMDTIAVGSDRRPLLEQVSAREKLSKGLPKTDPRKYWGFIKVSGEPGLIAQLPPPNFYSAARANKKEIVESTEHNQEIEPRIVKPKTQTIIEAVEDAKRIEAIKTIRAAGENRITEIISKVWNVQTSTRAYRQAREEYRRLTGE